MIIVYQEAGAEVSARERHSFRIFEKSQHGPHLAKMFYIRIKPWMQQGFKAIV
jgi:hypothetical protein